MVYEEITPYLNQIVQVNLKNRKRKVGWLVVDRCHGIPQESLKEVHCVKVRFGELHAQKDRQSDIKFLKGKAETFLIDDIAKIRSCL